MATTASVAISIAVVSLSAGLLSGCQGTSGIAGQMLMVAVSGLPDAAFRPAPGFRYLKAQLNNEGSTYLILGELEAHPNGVAEVWYTGQAQTIKTVDGRIVSTAGLPVNWLAVRAPAVPTWGQMAAQSHTTYSRERDVMPGYRLGIREQVTVERLPEQQEGHVVLLERAQSTTGETLVSRFEFEPGQWRAPVRSVQCLAALQCLELQPMPFVPAVATSPR